MTQWRLEMTAALMCRSHSGWRPIRKPLGVAFLELRDFLGLSVESGVLSSRMLFLVGSVRGSKKPQTAGSQSSASAWNGLSPNCETTWVLPWVSWGGGDDAGVRWASGRLGGDMVLAVWESSAFPRTRSERRGFLESACELGEAGFLEH